MIIYLIYYAFEMELFMEGSCVLDGYAFGVMLIVFESD